MNKLLARYPAKLFDDLDVRSILGFRRKGESPSVNATNLSVEKDAPKYAETIGFVRGTDAPGLDAGELTWELPEEQLLMQADGLRKGGRQSSPRGGGWRIIIAGNIIGQRHAVATAVPAEFPFIDAMKAVPNKLEATIVTGVYLTGKLNDAIIDGNQFHRVNEAVTFQYSGGDIAWPENFIFKGNLVRRCLVGVNVSGEPFLSRDHYGSDADYEAALAKLRNAYTPIKSMFITGNQFDLDPFHEKRVASRNADGTWPHTPKLYGGDDTVIGDGGISGAWHVCVKMQHCKSLILEGNVVRNAWALFVADAKSRPTVGSNTFFMGTVGTPGDPQKRILVDPNDQHEVWEDGNPTSATFGKVLYVKQRVGKETSATNSDLVLAAGVTWAQGELVYNLKPAVGHPWAWVCTAEGKVGTAAGPSFSELDPIVASPK